MAGLGSKRPTVQSAADGEFEPSAEVLNFRCKRTQQKDCRDRIVFNAAERRENRPFIYFAA